MKQSWSLWCTVVLTGVAAAMLVVVATGPALAAAPEAAPTLTAVDPPSAPNDLDTRLTITGTGFATVPTVSLNSRVLEQVGWVSAEHLTATLPWGLEPGIYTLTVANPGGESDHMPGAFTVTQGIGAWTTGGPYGGNVLGVALNPVTPTTLYAVVYAVGVFASFDGAAHWEPMLTVDNPTRLAFDAQDPDVIYCGGSGLQQDNLRSLDGGQTWDVYFDEFFPQNGGYTSFPAAHPTLARTIYLGTGSGSPEGIPLLPGEGGVYYSDDYGDTWVTRTVGLTDTDLVDLAFHPADPDTMAAAALSGNVFTTTNGGLTWQWAADLGRPLRRIYFDPGGTHDAWILPHVENQPPSAPYLLKSAGPGLGAWVTTPVTDQLDYGGGIWSLAFLSDTVWAAGERGYVSDDGGATWTPVLGHEGYNPVQVQAFAFPAGDEQRIYVGSTMHGVIKSTDGGASWQEQNDGLAALQVRGLASPRGDIDTVYANTFERGILRSDDGGRAWLELISVHGGRPKGQRLAADPFDAGRVYLGGDCEGLPCLRRSSDRGHTWDPVTMTLPITWAGWEGTLLNVAPHPLVEGRILAGAGFCRDTAHCNTDREPSGIYASDDHGAHWSFIGPTPAISEPLVIAFDQGDADLIYAGTRGMGLWRSTDGGGGWSAVDIPGTQPPVVIESIAPHPDRSRSLYVRLYSYGLGPNPQPNVFFSEDSGETWQELPDVDTVFGGRGGIGMAVMPPTPGSGPYHLFSGCEVGLCRTPDATWGWEQVEGAPMPADRDALVAAGDGGRSRLYIGTPGGTLPVPGQRAVLDDPIPGLGGLLGGGVYRYTTALPVRYRGYLPLVVRD